MSIGWMIFWVAGCGLVLNLWLFWKVGRLLGAAIYAAAAAASFVRFAWACANVHGFRPMPCPRWMYAPVIWGELFLSLLGARKGSVSHYGGYGAWKGIGDWTVFPVKEGAQ